MPASGLISIGQQVAKAVIRYGIKLGRQEDKFFGHLGRGLPQEQQRALRHGRYISQSVGITKDLYEEQGNGDSIDAIQERKNGPSNRYRKTRTNMVKSQSKRQRYSKCPPYTRGRSRYRFKR